MNLLLWPWESNGHYVTFTSLSFFFHFCYYYLVPPKQWVKFEHYLFGIIVGKVEKKSDEKEPRVARMVGIKRRSHVLWNPCQWRSESSSTTKCHNSTMNVTQPPHTNSSFEFQSVAINRLHFSSHFTTFNTHPNSLSPNSFPFLLFQATE